MSELYQRARQVDMIQLHDMLKALQTPVCTWNDDQIEMARDAIRKITSGIEDARKFLVESTGLEYALKDRERECNG